MAAIALPRPDLEAHAHAVRTSFPDVARELREVLGVQLVAYLGSVKETRAVHEWAEGERTSAQGTQRRLRVALQVARMVDSVDGREVTQAWFQGLNPELDDRSPARLIREGDIDEVGPLVIAAARAFLVGG